MLYDRLDRQVLQVRRIAISSQYPLYQHSHSSTGAFTVRPIHRRICFQAVDQLSCDHLKAIISHDIDRAIVICQSGIERDLILSQTFGFASFLLRA